MKSPLVKRLTDQAQICAHLGSALYAHLLTEAARDLATGGPTARILAGCAEEPLGSALGLRLLAAIHRQVLLGTAPDLAAHFPSVGGTAGAAGAWPAARDLLVGREAEVRRDLARPCQTNEPGRSVPLLAGLLTLSVGTGGRPVRLLEIGASAGLNLWPDAYRIGEFGPVGTPSLVDEPWDGPSPPSGSLAIVDRAGCDLRPVDPRTAEGELSLTSSVWADQLDRLTRLRLALQIVRDRAYLVQERSASDWLRERLAEPVPGVVTVVWHSVVWQYFRPTERVTLAQVLSAAARRASPAAPLARLSMEPERRDGQITFALRLTTWPGGRTTHLADAHGHGAPVRLSAERRVR